MRWTYGGGPWITPLIALVLALELPGWAADLRLVDTNLYDFSAAGPRSLYRIHGPVTQVYPQSVQVQVPTGAGFEFIPPPPGVTPEMLGMDDLQTMLLAMRIGRETNGTLRLISAKQYLSFGPRLQEHFRSVTRHTETYLVNYPTKLRVGQAVDCVAVPTADNRFFDYGIPFTGDASQFATVSVVLSNRIVFQRNPAAPAPCPPPSPTQPAATTKYTNHTKFTRLRPAGIPAPFSSL